MKAKTKSLMKVEFVRKHFFLLLVHVNVGVVAAVDVVVVVIVVAVDVDVVEVVVIVVDVDVLIVVEVVVVVVVISVDVIVSGEVVLSVKVLVLSSFAFAGIVRFGGTNIGEFSFLLDVNRITLTIVIEAAKVYNKNMVKPIPSDLVISADLA